MSDITELERRITSALDRIGRGLDGLDAPAPAGPDPETLAKLETANARIGALESALEQAERDQAALTEQLEAERGKAEQHAAAMDVQIFEQQESTSRLDSELQRLRRAAEDLRSSNLSLRSALQEGSSEPHLINKAMMAELETLRAARAVEVAQIDAVLATLGPIVASAAEGGDNAAPTGEADGETAEKEQTDA